MLLALFITVFILLQDIALCEQRLPPRKHASGFVDPPSQERCRLRYWLPDASVDPNVVKADIRSAGSVGAGGFEFLPYFEYGGEGAVGRMPPGANWDKYNFGTPAFQALFKAALEAHDENGLYMDFAIGPNQGQGVPAHVTDDGLQWDLAPFTSKINESGCFAGVIPGWGTGQLVAFTSALVVSSVSETFQTQDQFDMVNVTYKTYRLRDKTLRDQTSHVFKNGTTYLCFPAAPKGTYYRVFSFFQTKTLHKNVQFKANGEMSNSIFQNGSFAVDHFSARGAETVVRFWEENILTNGVKDLLIKVGNYAWEDSLEILANISWSRDFPARYEKKFGHSIKPYLPLLTFRQNNLALQPAQPGKFQCLLEDEETRQRYLNNYHEILADGYLAYVDKLSSWVRNNLRKGYSAQPAYNLPMDMLRSIPYVDAPECESFGFKDDIDLYRRFVGPAHLGGKKVISNELGALPMMAYQYPIPRMIFSMNRGFVAGINQYVLHGGQYTGNYYRTTWPGHTAFAYLFSEPWSEKQPCWRHGFQDVMDYAARVSHSLRQGVANVDVARYSKESVTNIQSGQTPTDLIQRGWSYTYISSDNFVLDEAYVEEGVLAPRGPAWRAMLIESSENLTVEAVKVLQRYTMAGLPVILSGGSPGFFPFASDTKEEFDREISHLKSLRIVHEVESLDAAKQLSLLGLSPRVGTKTNGTWYTSWTEAKGVNYALVYSDMSYSTGKLIRSPVLIYEQSNGMTTIPLALAGNQTVIIAFSDKLSQELPSPKRHAVSVPSSVVGAVANGRNSVSLHVTHSTSLQNAYLSDGSQLLIDGTSVAPAFQLNNWTLVVEHWQAPDNLTDASVIAKKHNTTHELNKLVTWDRIPALTNVSGVGYYKASFHWAPTWGGCKGSPSTGAYLNIGRILHTARLIVNGQQTPALDYFKPEIDISQFLKLGSNEVVIITATPMWNYLSSILPELQTAGSVPIPASMGVPVRPIEVGLVGPVVIIPFARHDF
ncbi:hypothetical protein BJX68DRAFT_273929 [Aspergillus pseudodeflectus]|uniref:Glycosyl hydrolases family 2 sugar binding domain-containing protein n=1 Tax=Aspergillus pseudodeflectus TaxID=176178 RepID=A0ABR4LED5_9EURO